MTWFYVRSLAVNLLPFGILAIIASCLWWAWETRKARRTEL